MTATHTLATIAFTLLAAPLTAQLEEMKLPFVDADLAFERAAASGKRVLVYQDWPA